MLMLPVGGGSMAGWHDPVKSLFAGHLDGLGAADEQDDGVYRAVVQQEVGRLQQARALLSHQEILLHKTLKHSSENRWS